MIKPLTLSQRLLERADASDEDCRTDDGDIMREADDALKAKDAEIEMLRGKAISNAQERNAAEHQVTGLRAALVAAANQLTRVYEDAFKQSIGYGLITTDGRDFSCYQLNQCQTAASAAREALKEKADA